MALFTRRMAVALGAVTAVATAAPAIAANPAPTSLNLRASKTVVKAHHTVTFTATLTSNGKAVSGEAANIVVQERKAPTTGHRTTWQDQVVAVTENPPASGHYTFTVSPPIATHKNTQKDQYRVVFKGDSNYAASHSQIITITVKRSG